MNDIGKSIRRNALIAANLALDTFYGRAKNALHMPMRTRAPLGLHEVDSHYMGGWDTDKKVRFVVSFIAGYDPKMEDVQSPTDAASAALELITGENSDGTTWCVFDRATRKMHHLQQEEFAPSEDSEPDTLDGLLAQMQQGVEKVSVQALRELAKMAIETAWALWGTNSEALADEMLPLGMISDVPPGTRSMVRLYRTAKAIYNTVADLEVTGTIVEAAEGEDRDRIAALIRDLKKLELDPKNPDDPLAALDDDLPEIDVVGVDRRPMKE